MLEAGVMGDAFFETFVAGELVKNLSAHGKDPREYLYYYRDTDQREVDLVYTERDDSLPSCLQCPKVVCSSAPPGECS